jgi:hypothetical protein
MRSAGLFDLRQRDALSSRSSPVIRDGKIYRASYQIGNSRLAALWMTGRVASTGGSSTAPAASTGSSQAAQR